MSSKETERKNLQKDMNVERVFHMTGGGGETSYAKNSSLQKKASEMVKHITIETIQQLYLTTTPKSIGMADLGCSSGPNSLIIIKEFIDAVQKTSRSATPEFRVFLNDLPSNDFNSIFKALPDFYREIRRGRSEECPCIYIAAYPGSFYGRLFPDNCLHFIYSSYSLHWLSRVPPALCDEKGKPMNKGNVYISESSPPLVTQAYFNQFQEDFSLFLRSRSQELVCGGRMVLILLGRRGLDHFDRGNIFFWELLSRSFSTLVSWGEIEEEKLDMYDVNFYAPCREEIEDEVRRDGSFKMDRFEMFEIEREGERSNGSCSYGTTVAMTVRAIQESMISHHFGGEEFVDTLFDNYARMVDEEMSKEEIRPVTFILVLRKL